LTQIGESVFLDPAGHNSAKPPCPFCPADQDPYTTYAGAANDSGTLGEVMANPDQLVSKQPGVRPKQGKPRQQAKDKTKLKPKPICSIPPHGDYSCEAHHVIPGKQSMDGEDIEAWLKAGNQVESDTGYSINNAGNGVWLVSIPEAYKGGKWGKFDPDTKLAIAKLGMAKQGQFHKGHHNIGDPEDEDGEYHERYPKMVKSDLNDLYKLIEGWSLKCFETKQGPPHAPTHKVNIMLDRYSSGIAKHLLATDPRRWRYFISRVALKAHKDVCPCRTA
jgi:hypothetical protein